MFGTLRKTGPLPSIHVPGWGGVASRLCRRRERLCLCPIRFADAIGATGLRAVRGEQRRVIVVILGDAPAQDVSAHSVATVRRFLERMGVPLHVWSLVGRKPKLEAVWGEVKDVSRMSVLTAATEELRRELESQRIAWLPVAPLDAFRTTADERCAFTPLARAE